MLPKRIAVTLASVDVVKGAAHFDLPIALGLLLAMSGILPTPIATIAGQHLICPAAYGTEAAWAARIDIIVAADLVSLLDHLKGTQILILPLTKY